MTNADMDIQKKKYCSSKARRDDLIRVTSYCGYLLNLACMLSAEWVRLIAKCTGSCIKTLILAPIMHLFIWTQTQCDLSISIWIPLLTCINAAIYVNYYVSLNKCFQTFWKFASAKLLNNLKQMLSNLLEAWITVKLFTADARCMCSFV